MSPIVEDIARRLLGSEEPQKITVQAEETESEESRYLRHQRRSPSCAFYRVEVEMGANIPVRYGDEPNEVTRAYALWSHLGGPDRGSMTRRTENGEVYYDFSVDDWEITDLNPSIQYNGVDHLHEDWFVLTDDEADGLARENLRESIQYAHSEFLAANTGLPEVAFAALVTNNDYDAIAELIEASGRTDEVLSAVLDVEGRGPTLATYDAEEHEVQVGLHYLYIYRVN